MAYLGMPENQLNVKGKDFIAWCDRYIRFSGSEQVTGRELYSARCGMVHTFGVESNLTRDKNVRKIGYMDQCDPPILFRPELENGLLLMSIDALAAAFYSGIDRCLIDLFAIEGNRLYLEKRIDKLCVTYPTDGWGPPSPM